jgi:polyhydroxyalkanoate synthase subunit PhaC
MNDMSIKHQPVRGLISSLAQLVSEARLVQKDKAQEFDRRVLSQLAEMSNGLSVLEIALAYMDWASHAAISPGKMLVLHEELLRKLGRLGIYSLASMLGIDAEAPAKTSEPRLNGENWKRWPFNVLAQGWLIGNEYWQEAVRDVRGARPESLSLMAFIFGQMMEAASPANNPLTNPDVVRATVNERGRNLIRGASHLVDDVRRRRSKGLPPGVENFQVGRDVACTPGKVVYQNALVELIQYAPQTETVDAEPVFIVPAWIMKYYILDLSPKNSLVRYLVAQGKTVFAISWKNPLPEDSELTMDDYVTLGILEPLRAIHGIVPNQNVNAVGYCIGGTLLAIAASHLAGTEHRLNSVTLLAAQTDFKEAGEIRTMLGESIFAQLEILMQKRGVLESGQMGGAFAALRSADLIWAPLIDRYFLGKEAAMNDLMAWNADGTRMPHRMHAEYLRRLYMDNDLAEGRFRVHGEIVWPGDIRVPMFVVGTVTDHVAPWKSVYKLHRLNGGELTFLLTTGGHNAGIVSGPTHPKRKYQMHTRLPGDHYIDPDTWQRTMPVSEGSWWPAWIDWLNARSHAGSKPPTMGARRKGLKPLRDAPGEYVMMR